MIEEFLKKCTNDYCNAITKQAKTKNPIKLTEDEKFSIAVWGGK